MIRLEPPFPPSVNRLWRHDPKSGRILVSQEYRTWKYEAGLVLRSQFRGQTTHHGPYKMTVHLRRKDSRFTDLDNRIKALSDALVKAKIVEDDRFCEHIDIRWVYEGPPCVVWITAPLPLTA